MNVRGNCDLFVIFALCVCCRLLFCCFRVRAQCGSSLTRLVPARRSAGALIIAASYNTVSSEAGLAQPRARWLHWSLTRMMGQIELGGRMWSFRGPQSHSGFTWEAHLLWSWGRWRIVISSHTCYSKRHMHSFCSGFICDTRVAASGLVQD